jgi:hypothetical protein
VREGKDAGPFFSFLSLPFFNFLSLPLIQNKKIDYFSFVCI